MNSGTVTVDTTGLATSAKQDTGNASLASIDTKLTNPLPISGTVTTGGLTDTQLRATPVPISGTITATATDLDIRNLVFATDKVDASGTVLGAGNNNIGDVDVASVTGNVTVVQGTGTNLHTVVDSGTITTVSTVTAVTAISNALPAGNNNIGDVDIASALPAGNNNIGDVDVATLPALVAGSAIIGKVAIDQTTPGTTNNVTTIDIPTASSTYALTNVSSTAYETGHILKGSAGYLFMLTGYSSRTTEQFIQLHNTTTVPADTAVPVLIFKVPAGGNFSFDLGKYGRYFSTGISICNSSTGPTKTIGSADCWFDAQVI